MARKTVVAPTETSAAMPDLPDETPVIEPSPGAILDDIMTSPKPSSDRDAPDITAPEPVVGPAARAPRRGGGFGTVLGGVLAAALGFGVATYVVPRLPEGWQPFAISASEVDQARLDDLAGRIETLSQEVANLPQPGPETVDTARLAAEVAQLRDQIAAISTGAPDLAPIENGLADLNGRLATLEKRPVAGGAASATAIDALMREVDSLRAQVAQQSGTASGEAERIAAVAAEAEGRIRAVAAEAEKLKADAEATARQSTEQSALRLLQAALDSGAPLDSALADLAGVGHDLPPALTDHAQGVPTLAVLQGSFPEAARAAIAASIGVADQGGLMQQLGAFLRGQSGARSLAPREGTDADAILSRAEAALKVGDLQGAVDLVGSLPAAAQPAMAPWVEQARLRIAAQEAVAALTATLK